jgi:hypothetical protein
MDKSQDEEATVNRSPLMNAICRALCKSGHFETGEGTCALICLDQRGDARRHCPHRNVVHRKLARIIADEVVSVKPAKRIIDDSKQN